MSDSDAPSKKRGRPTKAEMAVRDVALEESGTIAPVRKKRRNTAEDEGWLVDFIFSKTAVFLLRSRCVDNSGSLFVFTDEVNRAAGLAGVNVKDSAKIKKQRMEKTS